MSRTQPIPIERKPGSDEAGAHRVLSETELRLGGSPSSAGSSPKFPGSSSSTAAIEAAVRTSVSSPQSFTSSEHEEQERIEELVDLLERMPPCIQAGGATLSEVLAELR